MASTITVTYLDNSSEGVSQSETILAGTTLGAFFAFKKGLMTSPDKFLVRVKRGEDTHGSAESPLEPDFELENGDKIVVSPLKMEGGR